MHPTIDIDAPTPFRSSAPCFATHFPKPPSSFHQTCSRHPTASLLTNKKRRLIRKSIVFKNGGANRSRTDLKGFAVLCLTAWLSRPKTPIIIAKPFLPCKPYFCFSSFFFIFSPKSNHIEASVTRFLYLTQCKTASSRHAPLFFFSY